MDTISLSLTVLEIFDFKNVRVWPWPWTPEGHLGSKNFIPFGSPYMNSYLTSMDTISLSLTVSEIFNFKNVRVWPWPLTPEGHLRSRIVIPLERPYMTSYLTFMDTISLSLNGVHRSQIGIHIWASKRYKIFWPQMTFRGPRSRSNSNIFEVKYLENGKR